MHPLRNAALLGGLALLGLPVANEIGRAHV